MENSMFSSPRNCLSPSKSDDDAPEESGWTEYLENYSYNGGVRTDDDEQEDNSSYMSSSMVSDAGSGPEWKHKNSIDDHHLSPAVWSSLGGLPNVPKKLSFKNKRTQKISHDDSLEDTASSPVNSPKITMSFKRMDINARKADDFQDYYMDIGRAIDEQAEYKEIDNGAEFVATNPNCDAGFTELKKKGLCLVPVSMAANYIG